MKIQLIISIIIIITSSVCLACEEALQPKKMKWSFDGVFGRAAQRGFQVYKEVCSICHGLNNLYYCNLKDIGFSTDEIKEIVKVYKAKDGPNYDGEMFDRPALPSDRFVPPYPNEQAERASNNEVYPPDLSFIIKGRHDAANYIYSLLTGYKELPADFEPDARNSL